MTSQQIFTIVFQLVLTGGIGIITYFLKRTMDDIDKCKSGLDKVRENYVSKDEFDKCKTDITDSVNYLYEAGYIHLRTVLSKEPSTLADSDFDELEAKLTAKGISLLAGGINDPCIKL